MKWTRAEQILFHYFTGVQLRDADNDKKILSPNRRWNPLDFALGREQPAAATMDIGGSCLVTMTLQNTGLSESICEGSAPMPPPDALNSNGAIGG